MRHFLQYWKSEQADIESGKPLEHAASGQYQKIGISKDDVLWIVTLRDYRLTLLGRLMVDRVVGQAEAERHFAKSDLYEAEFHVIAQPGTVQAVSEVDVHDLALTIRFNSPNPELTLNEHGGVDGKQIQAIRELTTDTVSLFSAKLGVGFPTLVELLEKWGFDVRGKLKHRIKAVRHASSNTPVKWIYEQGLQHLETYQSGQSEPIFDGCDYIVSFLGDGGIQAKFIGVYRNLGKAIRGKDAAFKNPQGPPVLVSALANDTIQYHFERDTRFDNLREKIVIHWPNPKGWHQWLPENDKQIIGVADSSELLDTATTIASALGKSIDAGGTLDDEALAFSEGKEKYRLHLSRERSQQLINETKRRAKTKFGRLTCEVCGFDFSLVYGQLGLDFIECHHTIPVSEMPPNGTTRPEDMALLCANCHRMVHRRKPWPKKHELGNILVRVAAAGLS